MDGCPEHRGSMAGMAAPALVFAVGAFSCAAFMVALSPPLSTAIVGALPFLAALPAERGIYWLRFLLSFTLFGVLPAALMAALRMPPAEAGLRLPGKMLRSPLFIASLPIAFAAGAIGAISPGIAAYYPYSRDLIALTRTQGAAPFIAHFAAYFFLYYLPWEFFFRGFLLFPATDAAAGKGAAKATLVLALMLQVFPSTLLHFGHPPEEILAAVPAGIAFGVLAWKSRSFIPGLLIHACLGLGTDLAIVLGIVGAGR